MTLDKNGDGKISAEELKPQFPDGAPPDMPKDFKFPMLPVMKAFDTNGDGKLTRYEIKPQFPGGFHGPPPE